MYRNQIQGKTAVEIASSVEKSLHAGVAGGRLPTIRGLARTLRVSPVTVAAAYRLLQSRGLIVGGGRRGTQVRPAVHAPGPVASTASVPEGALDLASGNPDPDLLPLLAPHLKAMNPPPRLYGDALEFRPLVAFASAEFEADSIDATDVTVTSGALDAVERLLRAHLRPGDRVLVEDPTLPALLDLIRSLGHTPHACAVDDEGPETEALDRALGAHVRAAILAPRAQNPTGAAITSRRAADLTRVLGHHAHTLLIEIDSAGPVSGAPAITLIDPSRPHWAVVRST